MRATRLELMRDHVWAIYRSITGREPPEPPAPTSREVPSFDEVTRRFAALETAARANPAIAERVAPFSFAPPLDIIGTEREMVLELGVPGVERGDVEVRIQGPEVTVHGACPPRPSLEGQIYFHAEMARGPFQRVVRLPEPTSGSARIEVENGIVRIRLGRATKSPRPRA
jgi:HSP20 family protein